MKVEGGSVTVPPPPPLAVPQAQRALDDPDTLAAYQKLWRRVWVDFLIRAVPWVALLLVAKIAEDQTLAGAASFLLIPTAFLGFGPLARMSRLMGVKRALAACPWEPASVVRVPDGKVGRATAVQLGLGDDHGVTSVLAARQPRRRKRLPEEFQNGAWFAGDRGRGGVIALPGPDELTLVYPPRR